MINLHVCGIETELCLLVVLGWASCYFSISLFRLSNSSFVMPPFA